MQSRFSRFQLCDPMNYSLPGSSVHGLLQARILWSGLPCPPPGDLPDPGIKPVSLRSPTLAGGFLTPSHTWGIYQLLQSLIQLKFNPFYREVFF